MNCVQKPSLRHIALVRIAISLWQQHDIRALIVKLCVSLDPNNVREKWKLIEVKVIKNALHLPQPELLKHKVLEFVLPIGLEILKWIKYNHGSCYSVDLPNEFHWTLQGTIDKTKTAEALMGDEKIDVRTRYNLACIYCLENRVQELWNKIPENHRNIFHDTEDPIKIMQKDLVYLWTNDLYRIMAMAGKLDDCHFQHSSFTSLYAFRFAVTNGNIAAVEYFLPKLSPTDRDAALINAAKEVASRCCEYNVVNNKDPCKEYSNEILCFLTSHMREEQQSEIIKGFPFGVLKCFLNWPFQNCFIKNADLALGFLSEERYLTLLELIINKVLCGFRDCDYQNLFSELWNRGLTNYKTYVMDECAAGVLLPKMFLIRDIQYIKVIFKDASLVMKKCFIFGRSGLDICKQLIFNDDWYLLKFFITECISSKCDMIRLIQRYEEYGTDDGKKKDKQLYDNLFHLLDALLCGYSCLR